MDEKLNIVVAFDSFKGCLSSTEIVSIVTSAIADVSPKSKVNSLIIADGGEGTLDALAEIDGAKVFEKNFTDLENQYSTAKIVFVDDSCIIECAQTVGITKSTKQSVEMKTSKGVGEQIVYALDKGYKKFAVGLGGSGTNDVGLGMLQALGFEFYDNQNNKLEANLKNINLIEKISIENVDRRLKECSFKILSDVDSPLCGKYGATFVYGPQKGIETTQLDYYDKNIQKFASVVAKTFNNDFSKKTCAGAAGGLGYAFMQFLGAEAISGVDYILEKLNADSNIEHCDFVMTGEGHTDSQTANGKVPIGVAKLAKKHNKNVILISGAISEDAYSLNDKGIDYITSIQDGPISLEKAIEPKTAAKLLSNRVKQSIRLINIGRNIKLGR